QVQNNQIKAVLAYASSSTCRSVQLLAYLGETNAEKCGVCDVCLEEKKEDERAQLNDKIDFEICTLLQSQYLSLDDLVKSVRTGTDNDKVERIRELLDAGKIKADGRKYYL